MGVGGKPRMDPVNHRHTRGKIGLGKHKNQDTFCVDRGGLLS